jgi:hypothetical protein
LHVERLVKTGRSIVCISHTREKIMSKIKSQKRVQELAAKSGETLADKRSRMKVDWVALRAENLRRTRAAS